jgi:hypothetical protein
MRLPRQGRDASMLFSVFVRRPHRRFGCSLTIRREDIVFSFYQMNTGCDCIHNNSLFS